MSIGAGFTASEICELVFEFQGLAHGSKGRWLAERGLTSRQLWKWRDSVLDGDLDRGVIPRQGSAVKRPPSENTAIARRRAAEQAAHAAEVDRLNARIRELEQVNGTLEQANDALGKAIGLLHERNAHEPADTPMSNDRLDSSTPRTDSSPS
ncbi:hypothetical protein [Mycobacterium asiaticum]|uniref:Transposase n=1 Tax=Mycobacterium asiaticum TaxID=1790 RepID=A0A1A3CKP1_MYCAS|nr:hypothetical protein [Mycobacterium asiaticum]OBI87544.1 hypothetical protein A9X01_15925 [Mycobacterium asiaticum]